MVVKSLFCFLHRQQILYRIKFSYPVLSQNITIYNGCSKMTLKCCVEHLCLLCVTICYQPQRIWHVVSVSPIPFQGQTTSHLKLSASLIFSDYLRSSNPFLHGWSRKEITVQSYGKEFAPKWTLCMCNNLFPEMIFFQWVFHCIPDLTTQWKYVVPFGHQVVSYGTQETCHKAVIYFLTQKCQKMPEIPLNALHYSKI